MTRPPGSALVIGLLLLLPIRALAAEKAIEPQGDIITVRVWGSGSNGRRNPRPCQGGDRKTVSPLANRNSLDRLSRRSYSSESTLYFTCRP